jgi:hypothetical protein
MKLQARLAEAEDTIEGLNSRCTNLEKVKQKLATEVEDMQLQVGRGSFALLSLKMVLNMTRWQSP